MEDLLALYAKPYDRRSPVVCVDEVPVQLLGEVSLALSMTPSRSKRIDYEYKRNGTASIFVAIEPLSGRRLYLVSQQRTAQDYTRFMQMVSTHWADAAQIRLVQDNLNTHTPGSFYKGLAPEAAFALSERFEPHYTPTKASWLNMAEIEISALSKQCLDRRIASFEQLQTEVAACARQRDGQKITWRFTQVDARTKLKRHYPTIQN
jgi:hypothetical protein